MKSPARGVVHEGGDRRSRPDAARCAIRSAQGPAGGEARATSRKFTPASMPRGQASQLPAYFTPEIGASVLVVDLAAAGAAALHPGRQHGRLADLLEGGLVLRAGLHDRHRPRLHERVDFARSALPALQSMPSWLASAPSFHCASSTSFMVCRSRSRVGWIELVPPGEVDVVGRDGPAHGEIVDVGRHLVPLGRIARAGAGHGAVGDAALERAVDLGEGDRHRLAADRRHEIVERGAERADLAALEVGKARRPAGGRRSPAPGTDRWR